MPTRYRKNPETAGRMIDGVAFIITPDDTRLHTLNTTASHVWALADAWITAQDAAAALAGEFEVDQSTALADVAECLTDLVARKILVSE